MRGRKPIPSEVKRLNGNPGKRALNPSEPKPAAKAPACPAHVQGEARKEWRRIVRELSAVGIVTQLDRAALTAYVTAWQRWIEAEEQLRKLGPIVKAPSGFPIQNPYLAVANKAIEQVIKISAEFGLTPSSRSRVSAAPAGKATGGIESFLAQDDA